MSVPIIEVFPNGNPYLEHLGATIVQLGDGCATIELPLRAEFMNSWQVVQGGISMALLDVVMGIAASTLASDQKFFVTVGMNTTFLQPAGKTGETIVARGKAYHRTTTMCFCEAELWNAERLVAKATGTFKHIRRTQMTDNANKLRQD